MKSNPNKTIIKIKEETAKLKAYFENKNPEMLKDEYIIKYFQERCQTRRPILKKLEFVISFSSVSLSNPLLPRLAGQTEVRWV